ncbi:MAG: FAD-dependent oxidoreductase, partial [Lachnospiraceae bacterium]|nr:FAD-dependent oxidoreductase [Lachnospiraceae bacterium]
MENIFDVIIIGSGPAGLTCGIYAKRAELSSLLFEDPYSASSQITSTYEVDNYTGFHNIDGQTLYDTMRKHAESLSVDIKKEKVLEILDIDKDVKRLITKNGFYNARNVVLATGATPKKLGVKGEEQFAGSGVSYCATCDGAFFKDKIVAVVGGGDVAIEDAIFLSRICKKVYVLVRKDYMRATKVLQSEIISKENVEILFNKKIEEINGDSILTGIMVKDTVDESKPLTKIVLDGLFVAVGIDPNSDLYDGKVALQ